VPPTGPVSAGRTSGRPRHTGVDTLPEFTWSGEMNTQQRIDRLEDAVANLGTIIEAEGRWVESRNPIVRTFGEQFNTFVGVVARERAAKS
jgi:hypothetical protein